MKFLIAIKNTDNESKQTKAAIDIMQKFPTTKIYAAHMNAAALWERLVKEYIHDYI